MRLWRTQIAFMSGMVSGRNVSQLTQIAESQNERLDRKFRGSGRVTAYPELARKMEFCPGWRLNPKFPKTPFCALLGKLACRGIS